MTIRHPRPSIISCGSAALSPCVFAFKTVANHSLVRKGVVLREAPFGRLLVFASTFLLAASLPLGAQTSATAGTNSSPTAPDAQSTRSDSATAVRAEKIRAACLEGRRCVCGRVLKVFPTGVLVESGYPSLLRDSLHGAWHLPATVVATRETNLVEKLEPDSICVGTVFLTDLPRLRGAKIVPYDYVVLHSYPAGEFTYTSVGQIQHSVRRFAGGLETAVKLILQSEQTNHGPP